MLEGSCSCDAAWLLSVLACPLFYSSARLWLLPVAILPLHLPPCLPPRDSRCLYGSVRACRSIAGLHWFVGIIFMLVVSFFASLLRKVVRKKVLENFLRYPGRCWFSASVFFANRFLFATAATAAAAVLPLFCRVLDRAVTALPPVDHVLFPR